MGEYKYRNSIKNRRKLYRWVLLINIIDSNINSKVTLTSTSTPSNLSKNFKLGQYRNNPQRPQIEETKEIEHKIETKFNTNSNNISKARYVKEQVSSLHDRKFYNETIPSK